MMLVKFNKYQRDFDRNGSNKQHDNNKKKDNNNVWNDIDESSVVNEMNLKGCFILACSVCNGLAQSDTK